MKRLLFVAAALMFISGCATQAVKLSDAQQVPEDRVFLKDVPGEDTAKITIIRDSGFMSGGCYIQAFINGELAASIDPAEKVSFKVAEGRYTIGVTTQGGKGLCNLGDGMQEREFEVEAREERFYRSFIDANGLPFVIPTTQAH